MNMKSSINTFNISLPTPTSQGVIEWFEIMENNNILSEALIELVSENIKSGKPINAAMDLTSPQRRPSPGQINNAIGQAELFDSLYNWQDSNNAIFKDEKDIPKVKKKMLSV